MPSQSIDDVGAHAVALVPVLVCLKCTVAPRSSCSTPVHSQSVTDGVRAQPLRAASYRIMCRRPRWMPTSGILVAGEFAARLLVDELAEAVVEAALAVLDAGLEQLSPRPSALNSRMACGSNVMPTPSSLISGARS